MTKYTAYGLSYILNDINVFKAETFTPVITFELYEININTMKNSTLFKTVLFATTILLFTPNDAAAYFNEGGIYYNYTSTTPPYTVAVTSGRGDYAGDVNIPSTVTNENIEYTVTAIEGSAFLMCFGLTSVEIPNTVTEIGTGAFLGCLQLESVSLPAGITTIQEGTFNGCAKLGSIIIPPGVTSIDKEAFRGCVSMKDVYVMSPEPPALAPDAFSSYTPILHVPIGSLDNYKDDETWKNFTDTEETDFSGISQNSTDKGFSVYSYGGKLIITGIDNNTHVTVYDIQGKVINSDTYDTISNIGFQTGSYIIVAGRKERKVIIN